MQKPGLRPDPEKTQICQRCYNCAAWTGNMNASNGSGVSYQPSLCVASDPTRFTWPEWWCSSWTETASAEWRKGSKHWRPMASTTASAWKRGRSRQNPPVYDEPLVRKRCATISRRNPDGSYRVEIDRVYTTAYAHPKRARELKRYREAMKPLDPSTLSKDRMERFVQKLVHATSVQRMADSFLGHLHQIDINLMILCDPDEPEEERKLAGERLISVERVIEDTPKGPVEREKIVGAIQFIQWSKRRKGLKASKQKGKGNRKQSIKERYYQEFLNRAICHRLGPNTHKEEHWKWVTPKQEEADALLANLFLAAMTTDDPESLTKDISRAIEAISKPHKKPDFLFNWRERIRTIKTKLDRLMDDDVLGPGARRRWPDKPNENGEFKQREVLFQNRDVIEKIILVSASELDEDSAFHHLQMAAEVAKVNRKAADLFFLCDVQGWSVEQAAEELGIGCGSARNLRSQFRQNPLVIEYLSQALRTT